MSRLIVKGLPSRYDDRQLRELFESTGEVTDAKVIKTRDGRSRQFGFVGFRTPQDAKSARHRLNKSYVDTQRVSVDFALAVGAESIPRPWSRYSKGSSEYEKKTKDKDIHLRKDFLKKEAERNKRIWELKRKQKETEVSEKDKAALSEFEETAGKRASNPLWADGAVRATEQRTLVASRKKGGEGTFLERKHVTFGVDESEDEDEALYEDLPASSTVSRDAENAADENAEKGDDVALDHGVSDLDYLKSKVVEEEKDGDDDSRIAKSKVVEEEKDGGDDSRIAQEPSERIEDAKVESEVENASLKVSQKSARTDVAEYIEKPGEGGLMDTQNETRSEWERKTTNREGEEGVDASETGRLLVRNLAYSVTDEELETVFEPFGTLADVHVVRDPHSSKSRGIGFVQYVISENAPQALLAVDGTFHSGRILHVLPAKPRPTMTGQSSLGARAVAKPGNSKFKAEREEARKEAARKGLDSASQHAMHLSSGAVAEIMTDRHGVSKADLFGTTRGESGIAAVRLAMAEATIQGETKQFLLERGIDLAAATEAAVEATATTSTARRKRQSRTAFLVKNLPARSTAKQLSEVFGRFGATKRVVVVPSGTLAVVEYNIASSAKRAYNSLAYTKFRDAPLYLEWLPAEALKSLANGEGGDIPKSEADAAPADNKNEGDLIPTAIPANSDLRSGSVYIKNLNFDTRDAELKTHFLKALRKRPRVANSLRSATVAMRRKNEGKDSERLSMGFGFLEFSSRSDAVEAVKIAQNTVLDGHTLQLRLSNKGDADQQRNLKRKKASSSSVKTGPKLLVRNVAFEATNKDIRQLFSAFGQLKTLRIPKKMDGSHRGFAFVEFVSKNEAKAAFEALTSTHLYGRHLVIEYAEDSGIGFSSIAELQQRAATQMAKKRVRTNSGTAAAANKEAEADDENFDEQAMLEDELYS